jgi:NAD(P)-dependent dehydrogenase (short-subunit alcohol dehydrogenase family)
MAKLRGKAALITGAARGQGRSHAVRLAEDGADIVVIDIVAPIPTAYYPPAVPADLQLTGKLAGGEGVRVLTAEADVRDQAALDDVVARALAAATSNGETYAMFRPDVTDRTLEDAREVFRTVQLLPARG